MGEGGTGDFFIKHMDSVQGGQVLTADVLWVVGQLKRVAEEEGRGLVFHRCETQSTLRDGVEKEHFFTFEQVLSLMDKLIDLKSLSKKELVIFLNFKNNVTM